MYFIPRNNKIYSLLVMVPIFWLYALTLSLIVLLCCAWWTILYVPINNSIVSMQLDYAYMTQQQSLYPHMRDDIQKLERITKELHEALSHSLQETNSYSNTLNTIVSKGSEAGLNLVSCIPGALKNKDWYTVYPVDIQFSGTFEHVQRFLKVLALHDYPMRLKQITVKKQNNGTLLLQCIFNLLGFDDTKATP